VVRSITVGNLDLTSTPLVVNGEAPIDIQVRVAKSSKAGVKVRGIITDAVTRTKPESERMELCCFESGPVERMSTSIKPDGFFEFSGVPLGKYSFELQKQVGRAVPEVLNRDMVVINQDLARVSLVSAERPVPVGATITYEDGSPLPPESTIAISLNLPDRGVNGGRPGEEPSVPMTRLPDGTYGAQFPRAVRFIVSVKNVPEGYKVKSISGSAFSNTILTKGIGGEEQYAMVNPGTISIVLQKVPAR